MKTQIQKEMRKIRIKLKLHNITEEEKKVLREELERWRIVQKANGNNEKHLRDTSKNTDD